MSYESDIVQWSKTQAELLRSKNFAALDVENIANEIEAVGRTEQRELTGRMAVLLAYLLISQLPIRRTYASEAAIETQRRIIRRRLKRAPSLQECLQDESWWSDAYDDALAIAVKKTDIPLDGFPADLPWSAEDILNSESLT